MTDATDMIRRGDAVKSLRDWQDSLNKQGMSDTAITIGMAADLVAALPSVGVTDAAPMGWIIGDGQGQKWRCAFDLDNTTEWTADRNKALKFATRGDAEAYSQHDEDAWRIDPVPLPPALGAQPAPDAAQVRAEALREAANVDWSNGTDVLDKAPEFLTPWQRGLVAGQQAMRGAILALIDTPTPAPSPDVAALVDYVMQDDLHNRLTPRVVDIAYSAFMLGRSGKNKDDGEPCDWFNDTRPMVIAKIAKIRAALARKGGA